jgi:ribosomal biogenesis protein LAS1
VKLVTLFPFSLIIKTTTTSILFHASYSQLPHKSNSYKSPSNAHRFITGLADTQIDLTRDRPSWFPPGKSLQLPLSLLETRHRIVHRHLPSLAELKRAATESLEWLWEWYWAQLDHAFKTTSVLDGEELGVESKEVVKERLQSILKTYVKERKTEIRSRKKDSKAAETALSSYNLRFSPSTTTTPLSQTQRMLLQLLMDEKMILPTDKKLGSAMSGAFLIWTPFFISFSSILPAQALVDYLINAINESSASRAMVNPEMDPMKEGLHGWTVHILCSISFPQFPKIVEEVLAQCFSNPTFWNLRIAASVLKKADVSNKEMWGAVLDAASKEGEVDGMDVDADVEGIENALPVGQGKMKEKIRGPTKALGRWKPRPIGWLPEGVEDDE